MAATGTTTLLLGATAPAFSLPDPNGQVHELDVLAKDAAAVLVAFICNHCPYVKHIRMVFASRAKERQDRGVAVVGINSNDAESFPEDSPAAMAVAVADERRLDPGVISLGAGSMQRSSPTGEDGAGLLVLRG